MSNLSELLPAGAGAKSADFVASGTLGSGVTVALNSDGTVTAVGTSITEALGSIETFVSGATAAYISPVYDAQNQKIVLAYRDGGNSSYGTAVVGTVSGSTITFGTPVVFVAATTSYIAATFDTTTNKVVIAYRDGGNSNYGTAIVGTVSGTSISFGSAVVFEAASAIYISAVYDSTNEKVVVFYTDEGNSNYGTAIVGTVSGTSISFGTPVIFLSGYAIGNGSVYDPSTGKVLITYRNFSNQNRGDSRVGTVSGTSISFGTAVRFGGEFEIQTAPVCAYDSQNQKIVIAYASSETSFQYGWAVVGTISGTSVSYGTRVNFFAQRANTLSIAYDPTAKKITLAYKYVLGTNGLIQYGSVTGTTLTFGSTIALLGANLSASSLVYAENASKLVVSLSDSTSGSETSHSRTYQPPYSISNTDFIGITDQAIADTATGAVIVQGGVASGVTLPYYYSFGTGVVFDTPIYTDGLTSTYDSNSNKVVISYSDSGNSGYVTVVVGTVSGSDISFGTPVVAASTNAQWLTSTFDSSANKVVVAYRTATDTGEAVVGTVSGTSISFGSAAQFESGRNSYTTATFDSSNNKVVIAYQDNFNSDYGTIVVGTVSGTSISFGTPVVFNSATTYYPALTFDPNEGKVVLGYRDGSNGNAGTALVGTVSGTSISFGSSAVFQSGSTNWIAATFDSNSNKVLFVYNESTAGKVAVGTVSGTSISFGSPVTFDAGNSNQFIATFDSNLNQVFIVYRDQSNSTYGTIIAATISGTTATFSDAEVFAAVTVNVPQIVFDSNANKTVVSYVDTAATGSGTSIVTDLTNTLATASDYYVQADGSLSTTVSSVPAGRALSTTSILLEG